MSAMSMAIGRKLERPTGRLASTARSVLALALVAGADMALAYAAFDRGVVESVLGGVLTVEMLCLCIFRPRAALLVFAGVWGVVHVILSSGELEGGGGTSISQLVGVTVVLGFGIAVARLHSRRGVHRLPFPLQALLLFAVLYVLAELITPLPKAGLSDLIKLVGGLVLALLGYYVIDSERPLLALARVVGVAGVLVAGIALAQYVTGSTLGLGTNVVASGGVYRATSALGSANGTADFLLVCAGFVLLSYTLRRDHGRARVDLAMLAVIAIGIISTFTRADIVALVVMLVLWAMLWQVRSISAIGLRARLVLMLVAAVVGVVQVVGGAALVSRLEGRLTTTSKASLLNGREAIWSNELHKLESASLNTVLVGSGAHTSYTSVYIPQSEAYREFPPHDLFLWLMIETGVIGLLVYATALFALSRAYLKTARRSRYTPSGRVAAVAFATTIAFVVDSMFHNTQLSTGSYWYFMLFVGATLRTIELK